MRPGSAVRTQPCAPYSSPGGSSGSPTPEGPRAPRRPACPPSGTGRSGGAAGLPVPNWPAGSAAATRAPKLGSSSVQKREEVTEGLEEREAGPTSMPRSSPGGRQRWRRCWGSGTCVARGQPAAGSGLGRLQTPRRRCGAALGREAAAECAEEGPRASAWGGEKGGKSGGRRAQAAALGPGPGEGRRGARGAGPLPAARPGARRTSQAGGAATSSRSQRRRAHPARGSQALGWAPAFPLLLPLPDFGPLLPQVCKILR